VQRYTKTQVSLQRMVCLVRKKQRKGWCSCNVLDSYLEGTRFEFRPWLWFWWFPLVTPREFRLSISIRTWTFPSKSFPVHRFSVQVMISS
jgi:hypothetical protein